jgi:hypothetical protein
LVFVSGLYLLANLAATVKTASEVKFIALPFVSVGSAILHFSYGLGFLYGLIVFRTGWREKKRVKTADSTSQAFIK